MAYLHPWTFVFILVIVFCIGWCSALWWLKDAYARGYKRGVADCKKKLPEIATIAVAELTKDWSIH